MRAYDRENPYFYKEKEEKGFIGGKGSKTKSGEL